MKILLYSQILKPKDEVFVQTFLNELFEKVADVYIYEPYLQQLETANFTFRRKPIPIKNHAELLDAKLNFVITLGGDGTILHAIQLIRDSGIPVAGINLGRLGFLAVADQQHATETLDCLLENRFTLDPRRLIDLSCNLPIFQDFHYALNDFTITKRDTSSMIVIHTYLNGGFLNSYWADGLIVSTPTGSTGYSLSCGGPIIFPNSGNFVVTPIAPHNLNVRPIVLHDSSTISFEIEGRADSFLCTLDSRYEAVTSAHKISVTCASFRINLVRLNDYTFLSTIRTKLSWGIDSRN
jgi:NAD+ kinase